MTDGTHAGSQRRFIACVSIISADSVCRFGHASFMYVYVAIKEKHDTSSRKIWHANDRRGGLKVFGVGQQRGKATVRNDSHSKRWVAMSKE